MVSPSNQSSHEREAGAVMRLERIEAFDVELPYEPPFRAAWQPELEQRSRPMTFVRLAAGEGVVGWGATGGHSAGFIRERVGPRLVGEDLFAAERHAAA